MCLCSYNTIDPFATCSECDGSQDEDVGLIPTQKAYDLIRSIEMRDIESIEYWRRLAAEREAENNRLKQQLEERPTVTKHMFTWPDTDTVWAIVLQLVVLTAASFGVYCGFKFITTPARVSSCYIKIDEDDGKHKVVLLKGARDWNGDVTLGAYGSHASAYEAAKEIGCGFVGGK